MAIWVVTFCNAAVGYQRFGGSCCLHLHMVSQCRKPWLKYKTLCFAKLYVSTPI